MLARTASATAEGMATIFSFCMGTSLSCRKRGLVWRKRPGRIYPVATSKFSRCFRASEKSLELVSRVGQGKCWWLQLGARQLLAPLARIFAELLVGFRNDFESVG